MEDDAYRQYAAESTGWLHRGRAELVRRLIQLTVVDRPPGRLLEIGAGVGQNLSVLATFGPVDAAEISELGQTRIKEAGVAIRLYTDPIPFHVDQRYDVLCALDVIEHLEDDRGALEWASGVLNDGGHLIVTVPAFQWLFGDHDRALQHHRRYTKRSLLAALPPQFEVVRIGYFNTVLFPAVATVRLLGKLVKRMKGSSSAAVKQNSAVSEPLDRFLERLLSVEARALVWRAWAPFGLSVVLVARRIPL